MGIRLNNTLWKIQLWNINKELVKLSLDLYYNVNKDILFILNLIYDNKPLFTMYLN